MSEDRALHVQARTGAVLFDLDGTLADTDPLHARAWRHTAETLLGVTFSWADYREACLVEGLSPVDFLRRLGVDARSTEVAGAKDAAFRRLVRAELALAVGVPELLAALDAAGVPLAIVSSGSRRSVDTFVSTLWPVRAPAVTVSRDDTTAQKPSPEPYQVALGRLGRLAECCVAIEDTTRGTLAASRAGLRTIRISNGANGVEPAADLTVADLTALDVTVTAGGVTLLSGAVAR